MTIMTIMTIMMMMMILLIMVKKGAAAFCCCRLTSPVTKPDQRRAPGTQNIKTYPKYQNLPKISQFAQNIIIAPKYHNLLRLSQFAQMIKICLIIICSISKKITKTQMHCTFPALFTVFFKHLAVSCYLIHFLHISCILFKYTFHF